MKLFDLAYSAELTKTNFKDGEFIFLDVEASGLGDSSYPIEVGWVSDNGAYDSFLIKPCETWRTKLEWDAFAEQSVHYISQQELAEDGIDIISAATRLNESLQGKLVFSDMLVFDSEWLKKLFFETGVVPLFRLADIQQLQAFWGVEKATLYQDLCKKQNMNPAHRAVADAERYVRAYKVLVGL